MRATAIQSSFNGGEVSPRLFGRVDQALYAIACKTLNGWLPLVEGGAVTAPGTYYVEKAAGPCRLIPFEYNVTQGYVIEASNGLLRFYTNDVRIETAPGVPYEVASPYSHAETLTLDYQQSADVLYLAGGGQAPRKLSRTAAAEFSLAVLDLRNGPIGDGNGDESLTVTASATTGSVTLTASAAIFAETDVGSFFELEAADYNDVPSWEPGITVAAGDKRTFAGKVYECQAGGAGRTGTMPPVHDSGTEWDGMGAGTDINAKGPYGVKWTFLHGRYGLLRITAFTDPTEVVATVEKRLADSLTATASWRWAFGAFSDTRGWPDTVCIWGECLTLTKGDTAYTSVIGDLENFERRDSSGDFQHDLAGTFSIPSPTRIKWAVADGMLMLGTEKCVYPVERVLTNTGAAGPPVFAFKKPTREGSRKVKPIEAGGQILFVQLAGRKLLEIDYTIQRDRYEAQNLNRVTDHIGRFGFREIAWQQEPHRLVWGCQDNGRLAAMAYNPAEKVMGWCRRRLGGGLFAKSLCSIMDPEGKRDQLWTAAEAGGDYWILRMAKVWETGDDPHEAFLVDAGLGYDGAATQDFAGLDHLEGRTIEILADGKPHPERVVSGGRFSLDYPASKVQAGLAFTAVLETLPPEAGQQEGTAQGKLKRVIDVTLKLFEALGLRVRVQGLAGQPIETRLPSDPMDEAVPLYSGDLKLTTVGAYDRTGHIIVERYQPAPATLDAIIYALEVGE
ncbi:MAG TPA: hypothetical protein VGW34_03835 [Allosphingosinicella sp.]|nr:hypothetical protein [Allosphingosinicella sp.]